MPSYFQVLNTYQDAGPKELWFPTTTMKTSMGNSIYQNITLAQGVAFSILTFDEVAHTSGHPTLEHYEVNCHHHEFLALYPPPLTLASQLPDLFLP